MNSTTELMGAGALTMIVFAAVLMLIVAWNVRTGRKARAALVVIAAALMLFGVPIFGELVDTRRFAEYSHYFRVAAAVMLPLGLLLLAAGAPAPDAVDGPIDADTDS